METIAAFASVQSVVLTALCTIVPTLIYFIYKFSISEKSFEEVLAEQKRRSLEEEQKQKSEKSKKEKKFKKSWERKKKEKPEPEPTSEVTLKKEIPTIEIVEPKEDAKAQKQKSKKTNASPAPNQSNKAEVEKTKKSDSSGAEKAKKTESNGIEKTKKAESNGVEKAKKTDPNRAVKPTPWGPAEKQVQEKKDEKTVGKIAKQEDTKVKEVEKVPKKVETTESAGTANKKKKKEPSSDVLSLSSAKLLALIKEAALDTDEIQNLIDILLNKQKDSGGWSKRNDQLAVAKRNIQEKEQLLEKEHLQTQNVSQKLKEVREECNQLRSKNSSLEKNSHEQISKLQQELQAYSVRVKQLQDQCATEREKLAQVQKQFNDDKVKKQDADKVKVPQKAAKPENEAEVEALKKSNDNLQKVHFLLVEEHTSLVSSHNTEVKNLNSKVSSIKKELDVAKAKNEPMLKEIQALKSAKGQMEVTIKNMEEQINNEKKHSSELETQISHLASTKDRVAGDGQEVVHQNGDILVKDKAVLNSEEQKSIEAQKNSVITQITDELQTLKSKNKALMEEKENQTLKNNELREKNYKAMDALEKAEKSVDLKLKEAQAEAEKKLLSVKKEYEAKLNSAAASTESQSNLNDRLKELQSESQKRLTDYNGEVEKGKKLKYEVDTLNAKYDAAESTIAIMETKVEDLNLQIRDCQCRTKECLQRLYPSVSVDNSLPHHQWVSEFEKLAALAVHVSSTATSEAELAQLKEEYEEKLLESHRHMQKILSDTESTLQELQDNAESKEVLWQERLSNKESELTAALSERDALVVEKDAMQSTFQQLSQLEELQDKLKLLQSTLETTESERSQIEQKYDEVNKNCLNLRDQLENKDNQIKELQKDQASVHLQKEIDDLKSKLDKEKKISKDFSSQMIRLNSLVKIGQDALSAEQEAVKSLKQQLQSLQASAANANTQNPVPVESTPGKGKSSEKSKKKSDASAKK